MKLVSTLFLLTALISLLYAGIGQTGSIYISINKAKKDAAIALAGSHLSTLTITQTDIRTGRAAYINDKELRYNGSLYDIAFSCVKDGNTVLKVFHDEKEEGLLSDMREMIDGWLSAPLKNPGPHNIKKIVIKDFVAAYKFSFTHKHMVRQVLSPSDTYHAQTPLLAVLESPPRLR